MKNILTTVIAFVGSLMLASADIAANNHEDIARHLTASFAEVVANMGNVKDKDSAHAFAASIPVTKAKLLALHQAAQALPAPTEAEKEAVSKRMSDAQKLYEPTLMEVMTALVKKPDAQEIIMIIGKAMEDKEMREVTEELEKMYE